MEMAREGCRICTGIILKRDVCISLLNEDEDGLLCGGCLESYDLMHSGCNGDYYGNS